LVIDNKNIILQLKDERKFYYEPKEPNSLLDIPKKGIYEPNETEILGKILKPENIVFDIGANFGYFTVLFSNIITTGGVHSFEPVPTAFRELKRNVELNNCKNVSLNQLAIGDKVATVKISFAKRWGSVLASISNKHDVFVKTYDCTMTTLDEYILKHNIRHIDLIKCDVEGAEMLVLKGFQKLNSFSKLPIWLLETQEDTTKKFGYLPKDIFIYLEKLGYRFYYATNGKLKSLDSYEKLPCYNFFCIIPEKHSGLLTNIEII